LTTVFEANRNQPRQKVETHKTLENIDGISGCQKESKPAKTAF
jgi:hypothetical protein